jgi:hypothetical protein
MQDECAVWKFLVGRFVEPAYSAWRRQAFEVKLMVNCIGTVLAWIKL